MYTQTIKLKDNELPAKINVETGEVKEVNHKKNNIPEGKVKLDYEEFVIVNQKLYNALTILKLNDTEIKLIHHLIGISKFNSNSLEPLHDDLQVRYKDELLNINKSNVNKITQRLFEIGVFLKIEVYTNNLIKYWVLNPYISWKGNLVSDSLKQHFKDCVITKLLS